MASEEIEQQESISRSVLQKYYEVAGPDYQFWYGLFPQLKEA
jgi:hypothetical protein